MIPAVHVDRALADPRLLGAGLGDLTTWTTWMAVAKAAYGRPLNKRERAAFAVVAGDRAPPTRKVRQLVAAVSRRGGKGRIGAALAVYEATMVDHSSHLAPGETGVVACISPTRAQANVLLNYCRGYLDASPLLRSEVQDVTADEVRLKNGVVICVLTSDYRTLRGRTLLMALIDEAAFLRSEESSSPDIECSRY
jgi:phage terminase large subunit-like protein